jgi:hypothetical protein
MYLPLLAIKVKPIINVANKFIAMKFKYMRSNSGLCLFFLPLRKSKTNPIKKVVIGENNLSLSKIFIGNSKILRTKFPNSLVKNYSYHRLFLVFEKN